MNKANAKKILELIGEMTIRELDDRGALGAFLELWEIANPTQDAIIIKYGARHENRIRGIKTIRVITEMGLKEAKDLADSAKVVGDDLVICVLGLTRDIAINRMTTYLSRGYSTGDFCQIA